MRDAFITAAAGREPGRLVLRGVSLIWGQREEAAEGGQLLAGTAADGDIPGRHDAAR
jgi:hypothetical protein